MMLLAVGQIVLREIFSTGFVWADELIKLMVLWLAMVGSIAACRENRHIRIDALSHILPRLAVEITRVLVDLFAAFVCGVVAWYAWLYLQVEIEYQDTVLVNIPAWIAHSVLPAAFLLISFRFLVLVVKQIGDIFTSPYEEQDG
jgi:TRAP-type C4-dicarboxylate transport system permease small subunit